MGYRAPVEGLQRRLAELEEELASLRGAPPPTAAEQQRHRTRSHAARTLHALEQRLAKLDAALVEAGCRSLTPKEERYLGQVMRFGGVLVVLGLLVASFHLVVRARLEMTWVESSCFVFEEEEDVHVARYESHGRQHRFAAPGQTSGASVRCWVPEPPSLGGLGQLQPPTSSTVRLADRLSWTWLLSAALLVGLGIVAIFSTRMDAENRRRGVIARDYFASSED